MAVSPHPCDPDEVADFVAGLHAAKAAQDDAEAPDADQDDAG